jgi:hypothetical protein
LGRRERDGKEGHLQIKAKRLVITRENPDLSLLFVVLAIPWSISWRKTFCNPFVTKRNLCVTKAESACGYFVKRPTTHIPRRKSMSKRLCCTYSRCWS